MFAQVSIRSYLKTPLKFISKPILTHPVNRSWSSSSSSSSGSKIGEVRFDQTKKNNNPEEEHTEEHSRKSKYAEVDESGVHPAKKPDPEEPTSRSTGIKTEGQGVRAGEGENKDVHKETREKPGPYMTWGDK